MKNNTFWLIVVLVMICFYWYLFTSKVENKYTLTPEQKGNLAYQIGTKGVRYLTEVGCEKPVAKYIITGEWSDKWCARTYRHVDWSKVK